MGSVIVQLLALDYLASRCGLPDNAPAMGFMVVAVLMLIFAAVPAIAVSLAVICLIVLLVTW